MVHVPEAWIDPDIHTASTDPGTREPLAGPHPIPPPAPQPAAACLAFEGPGCGVLAEKISGDPGSQV